MPKSKFFRIAVEGGTTDGREIDRAMIEQAAGNFNIATYTPRINCEHLRGFSPDAPFNAYGSVVAVKAEETDIVLDGKTEKRLGLFAQLDPNDQLIAVNGKGQKLFTSCEFAPNFGGSGKWGLVGLAVTDSPASLGTEMLKFCAGQGDNSPLAARKQDKANLFTAATDFTLELEAEAKADDGPLTAAINRFTGLLAKLSGGEAAKTGEGSATPPAPPSPPAAPANDNASLAELATTMGGLVQAFQADRTATDGKITALTSSVQDLTQRLSTTPAPGTVRPIASGGGNTPLTDC